MFIRLLTGLLNASNHTKCIPLSNQKCEIHHTFINLHPDQYRQEFHYYAFTVKLDKCVGSCNTVNDLSNKVCVPNKMEDLNLGMFNIMIGINELKTLKSIYHANVNVNLIKENVIKINGGIMINVNVGVKNITYTKKITFGILVHVFVKMENI